MKESGQSKRPTYPIYSQKVINRDWSAYFFACMLIIILFCSFFASFFLILGMLDLMRLRIHYAFLLLFPTITFYVLTGFIFLSHKTSLRSMFEKRFVTKIIGAMAITLTMLGIIPIVNLTHLQVSFVHTLASFLAVMISNIAIVLLLMKYPTERISITAKSVPTTESTFITITPTTSGRSFIGLARITYYSDSSVRKFVISPVISKFFKLSSISETFEDFTRITCVDPGAIIKCKLKCKASKKHNEYNLSLKPTLIINGIDTDTSKHDVYEYLDKINVYIDDKLSSIITFHEASTLKPASIPLIKVAENALIILEPVVSGISTGHHMITLEFINPSGKVLCTCKEEVNIPEGTQEEKWAAIPSEILLYKLKYEIEENLYVTYKEIEENAFRFTEHDDRTRVSFSFSSLDIDSADSNSRNCIINGIKIGLKVFHTCDLKIIRIAIDGEHQIDIIFKQPLALIRGRLYIFKIPQLPALEITAGTHTLMISLLEEKWGSLVGEENQEILTYMSEFTCATRKYKQKTTVRRKKKMIHEKRRPVKQKT